MLVRHFRAFLGEYNRPSDVFVIPVAEELDLKKAALAAGEKSIEMLKSQDLLPLTGYIHGGCSPVGMKKVFRTFLHESAGGLGTIFVSGGKAIGLRCTGGFKESDSV